MRRIRMLIPALLLLAVAPAAAQDATGLPLRLVVNVPAGRLYVYEGGQLAETYPVSVGLPQYRTPRGAFQISRVIWNPWWNPPPDSEWARGKPPVSPGYHNPMGRVKLHMEEMYYIHGTVSANEAKLGRPASHGCIRMSNKDVVALARRVHAYAAPQLNPATLDALVAAPTRTREVGLSRPISLQVTYDMVEVRDDRLVIHPDVYRLAPADLDKQIAWKLLYAGYHPAAAQVRVAEALTGFRKHGRASVSLAAAERVSNVDASVSVLSAPDRASITVNPHR
ncbi:hypothetical protein BH24GEM2_BH24GEM2_00700 [soil metagenome]